MNYYNKMASQINLKNLLTHIGDNFITVDYPGCNLAIVFCHDCNKLAICCDFIEESLTCEKCGITYGSCCYQKHLKDKDCYKYCETCYTE
jgi:hypothetical protein